MPFWWALLLALPFFASGCAALVLVPRAIDQMMEGPSSPTGFEYYRNDGETASGQAFRIRHFVDPEARRRYVVALIDGRLFSSRAEDVSRDMEAARKIYGSAEGKSEAEVTRLYGVPQTTSRFEDVRVLWYVRDDDEGFALVFRQDRCVTSFRLDHGELERMLKRPSPYSARVPVYGPWMLWTNRKDVTLAR